MRRSQHVIVKPYGYAVTDPGVHSVVARGDIGDADALTRCAPTPARRTTEAPSLARLCGFLAAGRAASHGTLHLTSSHAVCHTAHGRLRPDVCSKTPGARRSEQEAKRPTMYVAQYGTEGGSQRLRARKHEDCSSRTAEGFHCAQIPGAWDTCSTQGARWRDGG